MEQFTIPAHHLKAAMIFQAKGDVRYYLNGVYLNKEKGRTEAANGYCLIAINSAEISDIPNSMIIQISGSIPASAFYADVTMIDEKCGVIEFRDGAKNPVPKSGTRKRAFFDVIEGKYPDIDKVLPSKKLKKIEKIAFNPEYMGWAAKASKALGAGYTIAVAKFMGDTESIELEIKGIDDEAKVVVMPCRY
jgi:DNA polymerase-3 subunit beta